MVFCVFPIPPPGHLDRWLLSSPALKVLPRTWSASLSDFQFGFPLGCRGNFSTGREAETLGEGPSCRESGRPAERSSAASEVVLSHPEMEGRTGRPALDWGRDCSESKRSSEAEAGLHVSGEGGQCRACVGRMNLLVLLHSTNPLCVYGVLQRFRCLSEQLLHLVSTTALHASDHSLQTNLKGGINDPTEAEAQRGWMPYPRLRSWVQASGRSVQCCWASSSCFSRSQLFSSQKTHPRSCLFLSSSPSPSPVMAHYFYPHPRPGGVFALWSPPP